MYCRSNSPVDGGATLQAGSSVILSGYTAYLQVVTMISTKYLGSAIVA